MLPVFIAFVFALLQLVAVSQTRLLVVHAARDAARAVALDPTVDPRSAAVASTGLDPAQLQVESVGTQEPGSTVTVTVTYRHPVSIPLFGSVAEPILISHATMLVEGVPFASP